MFDEAGKIDSVRIYLLRDETAEIAKWGQTLHVFSHVKAREGV